MFTHTFNIRVRYAETDQMGFVYYGNYATYYEVARVEAFRSLGISYKEIEEKEGLLMPVIENKSKYLKPARYDDLLEIRTYIKNKPSKKTIFTYEIFNEPGELIHIGETILVFIKKVTGKPCSPPKEFIRLLTPFFDE